MKHTQKSSRTEELPGLVQRGGKFLLFGMASEKYAIDVLKIHEIVRPLEITRVPHTDEHILGVVNLRGRITPVIDMRLRFGLEIGPVTPRTCIIVVRIEHDGRELAIGLFVDEVREVLAIPEEQIEDPPGLGGSVCPAFVHGMARVEDDVLIILDIDKILTASEASTVDEIASDEKRREVPETAQVSQ